MIEKLKMFVTRWIAFFRPIPGWKKRILEFKAGRTVWEVPNRPDVPKLVPFPLEWVPHRLELTDDDDEGSHARGWVMLSVTCIDSGEEAGPGVAVSCLRCGVPLHPRQANMIGGFDPPYCARCKWPIKLA